MEYNDTSNTIQEILAGNVINTIETHGNAKTNAREEGAPLREIIQKARAISETYHSREEFRTFKWLVLISIGLIIIAVLGGYAAKKCLLREGAPLLMAFRLLTATNRQNDNATGAGNSTRPIIQPIVLVHQEPTNNQPAISQSRIQKAIEREMAV